MEKFKCKYCDKEYNSYNSLRVHSSKIHNINSEKLYIDLYHNGKKPTCKCGCGEFTTRYGTKGFREYKKGHIARIHNNWGHNQKAIDKSSETRRKQYLNGERQVWNKGLTKESDARLKKQGETFSSRFTEEERKIRSDRMRKYRLDGTVNTPSGKNHWLWKGGISYISAIVRNDTKYYNEWIFPILKRDDFKCVKCKGTKKLQVHHTDIQFSEICAMFINKEKEYSHKDKKNIAEQIANYHIENNIAGETLCKKCHKELHSSYNF